MKSTLALYTLLAIGLCTTAQAQNKDPVSEQIRLTQDSVRIALNEVENGVNTNDVQSVDGDAKVAAFNLANKEALRRFEVEVRTQVLVPMQILVNQYNQNLANTTYPADVKAQIKQNLLDQLTNLANERQNIYLSAIQRLHSNMGRFPVAVGYTGAGCKSGSYVSNTFKVETISSGVESSSLPLSTGYTGTSAEVSVSFEGCMNPSRATKESLSAIVALFQSNLLRRAIADGCFTSTCYFQTVNAYIMWSSLVSSLLDRPLLITLADGTVLTIRAVSFNSLPSTGHGKSIIASQLLAKALPGATIPVLHADMSELRLSDLRAIQNSVLSASFASPRACKASIASRLDSVCRSSEGCVTETEKALFSDRVTEFVNGRPANIPVVKPTRRGDRRDQPRDDRPQWKIEEDARNKEIADRLACLQ